LIPAGAPAGQCVKCLLGYADESNSSEGTIQNLSTGGSTLMAVGEGFVPDWKAQEIVQKGFGDFEFLSEGKEGGMGVVYRARQISLNRIVGLKMIRAGNFATERDVQRFRMEAEAAASLNHPHIVPIYEIGEHEGRHYFAMNWIEGKSLSEALAGSPLPGADSASAKLMVKIAWAIHHAHERGILHRDLKPANILIDRQGEPHITDFGLAKRLEGHSEMTASGVIMGTPSYMSPEQAEGKNRQLTTASDIFSLGSILYQLLTGKTPFAGETGFEIIKRVIESEPARPRELSSNIDRDLETICLRCLQKQPQRRYLSAGGLARDLENWLEGKPIAARPVSDWERLWKWVRRHPAISGLSSAIVMSILVGLFAVSWQWRLTAEANVRLQSQRADNFLAANKAYLALDTLAQMLRKDPKNRVAAERLINILNQRVFLIPKYDNSVSNNLPASSPTDCLSRDGKLRVSRQGSRSFSVMDVNGSNTISLVSNAHSGPIRSLRFSPDGQRVISASADSIAKVWSTQTGRLLYSLTNKHAVMWAEFSPDGSTIVTATEAPEAVARLWDADTGVPTLANPMSHEHGTINRAHFSPSGKLLVTASDDGTAKLWETDGSAYSEPVRLAQAVDDARFSPDGNEIIITPEDRKVRTYRSTPGMRFIQAAESEMPSLKTKATRTQDLGAFTNQLRSQYSQEITCLDLCTNLHLLATASSDKSARLWDVGTLRPATVPMVHETTVNCVRFSPDGLRLVTSTAGPVTRVRIWDTQTGQPLTDPIPSEFLVVVAVDFSKDGRWVITNDGANNGWKWRLYPISGRAPAWLSVLASAVADMPDEASTAATFKQVSESVQEQMFANVVNSLGSTGDSDPLVAWARDFLR